MNKLKRLLDSKNIKLNVAVYPWPTQIWYEDIDSIHVKIWKEWCTNNNINFINYFPKFIKVGSSRAKKTEILNKYYIPADFHFNKNGNKLIAQELIRLYK